MYTAETKMRLYHKFPNFQKEVFEMRKNWFKAMGLMMLVAAIFGVVAVVAASPLGPDQTIIMGTWLNPTAATAEVGENIVFVAGVSPATAHLPVTYTWDFEGAPALIVRPNMGITDTYTYNWPQAGEYTVIVTPSNMLGEGPSAMSTVVITAAADAPDMVVMVSGPITAMAGMPVTYTVSYSNTGMGPATGVSAAMEVTGIMAMPVPVTQTIGDVAVGVSGMFEYVITPPATFGGTYTTTVTLQAQGDSNLTNNANFATTTVTRTRYCLFLPTVMRNF
jgi:hypothetical protein